MRRLASVAIVLAGLLCFAYVPTLLSYLTFAFQGLSFGEPISFLALGFSALPVIAAVLLGLYLIYNRHQLASKLFVDDEELAAINPADIMRLVVLGLGLSLLSSAFTTTVAIFVSQAQMVIGNWSDVEGYPGAAVYWLDLLKPLAALAAGWFLIARSRRIATWLWRESDRIDASPDVSLPTCPSCGAPYDSADYESDVDVITCDACKERVDIVRG